MNKGILINNNFLKKKESFFFGWIELNRYFQPGTETNSGGYKCYCGICTSSGSGPVGTTWGSTRSSARSCTLVGTTPSINRDSRMKGLRAALRGRTWGYWWMKSWTWPTTVHSSWEGQLYPGLHQKQRSQQVEGGDSVPLLRFGETPPGVLCPALKTPVQERHGSVGASAEEGRKNDRSDGAPLLWAKAEGVGVVQPGEKKGLWRPYCGLSVLKGGLGARWGQAF